MIKVMRRVGEIDAENAERLLLLHVLLIQQSHVNNDLRRVGAGRRLKSNAQPAVRFVFAGVTFSGNGVGEDKKSRFIAALGIETLVEQTELMVEHRFDALFADVTFARPVDGVAER